MADYLGVPFPRRVPLRLAKAAVGPIELAAKMMGKKQAPILTRARMKFMTLNLDYSIDKAKRELGYDPQRRFPGRNPHRAGLVDGKTSAELQNSVCILRGTWRGCSFGNARV